MNTGRQVVLRVGAVVLLTMALAYVVSLANLALANQQALEAEAQVKADVVGLDSSIKSLETATVNAGTQGAVEAWARDQRKWAREGDHVIVAVPATPTPMAADREQQPAAPRPWDRLRQWLRLGSG
jgi:hypothetical protein